MLALRSRNDVIRGQADTRADACRRLDARSVATRAGGSVGADELERVAELCGRIDLDASGPDLTRALLEPVASFVRAETAALRCLDRASDLAIPRLVASLDIPDAVGDAYLARYHKLDPARRLPQCRLDEPVFADPNRPGIWMREVLTPALMRRYREQFAAYLRGFLIPNDFVHHVVFCLCSRSSEILLFDFQRGRRASPFDAREVARARAVARYLHARAASGWAQVAETCPRPSAAGERLSVREFEVAEAVAGGLSNKEVAASLDISVRTVENHMRSIFAKLGVSSRTRLAVELRRVRA